MSAFSFTGRMSAGEFGGAFKATKGLATEFPGRVLNTPISEDAIVGTAIGAAMQGMRPIVEMQFADFSSIALNQILNNAGTHYWRTGVPVPITVRLPSGGTKGSGPFHSQSMESIYAHYPGLIVMTPATVEDAYTMLIEAVAIDDPVVYCEHKYLYYHLKADKLPNKGLPTGKRALRGKGATSPSSLTAQCRRKHSPLRSNWLAKVSKLKSSISARSSRWTPTASWHRSPAPGACFAWANHFPGEARRRKLSRASLPRFSSARCRAATPQRERHTDPVSSQSLVGASPERKKDRRKSSRPPSRINLCRKSQS